MAVEMKGGGARTLEFVLGRGAWRIWHFVQILLVLPVNWFATYFAHFEPGAGPQGGEAVFALMLAYMLVYLVVATVNALLQGFMSDGTAWQRWLVRPALLLLAWLLAVGLVLTGAEFGTAIGATAADRWCAIALVVLAFLIFYGVNFWALSLARNR